jgi:uncharacterized protein YdeI (YjbR/CyaY-like superfamily)
MAASKHDNYPVLEFGNAGVFEKWLEKNHSTSEGIWLKMAKAKTGVTTVTYPEAVEISLCYGWIDGLARRVDDVYYVQKFTPRRPRSIWSEINRKKVALLIESGRMRPAGLAAIEEAKRNGRWDSAYASPKNIVVPEDFQVALNKVRKASAFFRKLDSQNRYAILFRLAQIKREDTRKRKIDEYVKMLAEGRKIY